MSENTGFSEESLRKIAEQKVNFRFSVKIHVAVFIIVNVLLIIVNFIFTPGIWWFVYPFFGWLIGVTMHSVAYSLYAKGVYPLHKRGVIYHLCAFITVMILLFITNFMTLGVINWAFYPAIFWGAGLVAHIVVYLLYYREKISKEGVVKSKKEAAIEKEMQKMRKRMNKQKK